MPRSRAAPARGGAPTRPSAPSAPARPAPQQQQTRPMSTAPTQQHQQHAPPPAVQQSQGPGLFGQMASTAAGVAVGSSIGHAIGGFFGGGSSSSAPAEQQQQYQQPVDNYSQPGQAMDSNLYSSRSNNAAEQGPCANDIRSFTSCMEQNKGDLNVCGWYLEQLKACQAAAGKY